MKVHVVVGLGQFGEQVARALARAGREVIAIDADMDRVEAVKDVVARAARADCTSEGAMRAIGAAEADAAVIALGEQDFEPAVLGTAVQRVTTAAQDLRRIYDEHAGVRDRFVGAGQVTPELARRLGLAGLAGRASGQACDLRADCPWPPYDQLHPVKCVQRDGDVAARVAVRFDELQESGRLVAAIVSSLPRGDTRVPVRAPAAGLGIGLVEGWRGPVLVALEAAASGGIRRCHPHDPSWQNWPVLEHAIIGNIVPDFPLINK
jgi:Ni,Fe-hydrogenase III large subunit